MILLVVVIVNYGRFVCDISLVLLYKNKNKKPFRLLRRVRQLDLGSADGSGLGASVLNHQWGIIRVGCFYLYLESRYACHCI